MASSMFLSAGGFSVSGSTFGWPLGTTLTEVSQGVLTLGPGSPVLNFGGTTSSFPAIRRNSALFEFILADSSAFCTLSGGTFNAIATGNFFWTGRSILGAPANGQMNLTNNAATAGVGLDFSTDAVLLLRTRAQSAYATLDVLGLKASGTAGANFGPSAVASLTIVNGVVTAAS